MTEFQFYCSGDNDSVLRDLPIIAECDHHVGPGTSGVCAVSVATDRNELAQNPPGIGHRLDLASPFDRKIPTSRRTPDQQTRNKRTDQQFHRVSLTQ
jgi:hypothetical protein